MLDDRHTEREPVSCCIITYNEADNIEECLKTVSWADEIIIVDSHSTDETVEIAARYTDRIIARDFEGHVEQKNFAVQQSQHKWVLCVDADERVTPELSEEIEAALKSPEDTSGYDMPRLTWYLGRFIRHGGWYPDRKLRLFRKDRGGWEGRNPHDHARVEGKVVSFSSDLIHYTYRDIADHINKINLFTGIAAKELHSEGRKAHVTDLVFRGSLKFMKMYIIKGGWLDGLAGLIIAWLGCFTVVLKYARLWELNRKDRA